jgi:hypothetical protein
MTERDEAYLLRGKIQMDDAYLGGELSAGKAGRGSENKIPIVAAVSFVRGWLPDSRQDHIRERLQLRSDL